MNPDDPKLDVAMRSFRPHDIHFILNSWVLGYRTGRPPQWSRSLYMIEQPRRIRKILERRPLIRVACQPLDTNEIFGYIVAEPPLVHWVYVKRPYREHGIALQLLASAAMIDTPILCSHWTSFCGSINEKKPDSLKTLEI